MTTPDQCACLFVRSKEKYLFPKSLAWASKSPRKAIFFLPCDRYMSFKYRRGSRNLSDENVQQLELDPGKGMSAVEHLQSTLFAKENSELYCLDLLAGLVPRVLVLG